MRNLARAIQNLPRNYRIGDQDETLSMALVNSELEAMIKRSIRIHTCSPSESVVRLASELESPLIKTIQAISATTIYIADPDRQRQAEVLATALKKNHRFQKMKIRYPNDAVSMTIGAAIENLEKTYKGNPTPEKAQRALVLLEFKIAQLIQTTLVFVL